MPRSSLTWALSLPTQNLTLFTCVTVSFQDESHFLKNIKTARCRAAMPLLKVSSAEQRRDPEPAQPRDPAVVCSGWGVRGDQGLHTLGCGLWAVGCGRDSALTWGCAARSLLASILLTSSWSVWSSLSLKGEDLLKVTGQVGTVPQSLVGSSWTKQREGMS